MTGRTIKPIVIAFMAMVFTLSAAAQAVADNYPMQGRRGTHRTDWVSRRAAKAQDRGPGGNYFKGEKHQLVVLASFANNPFLGDSAATIAQWDKILNTKDLDEEPFFGSVRDYFYDQSYGQFSMICDLQFVRVDSCRRYRSTITDDENSQFLVRDVIASLKQRDIDWDLYDWNGDGYVNQLLIIYAGQGSAYGGMGPSYDAIWPHQWWLSERQKPGQPGVYCDPDTVRYQDKDYILDAYCAVQELARDSTYGSFGTLCHEYTHCFGFPDFYNYNGRVIGDWDIMDSGNYSKNGFCPTGYSAHERWIMGWLTPIELTTPFRVTEMPALSDQPEAYLIRNAAHPDEFYLLENRQKKGWDASLPGSGLVVFHVDYDPYIWLMGEANGDSQQHYVIIPANNRTSVYSASGWAYPYNTNNALTDSTAPAATLWHANTSGELLMSKPVFDISVENGLASFTFLSVPTDLGSPAAETRAQKIFRDGQLIILHGDKTYTIHGTEIR